MGDDAFLNEDIKNLRQLDILRKQTKKMINTGIDGLFAEKYSRDRPDWRNPAKHLEKALILSTILLHDKKRSNDELRTKLLDELNEINVRKLFRENDEIKIDKNRTPVVKACIILEILSKIPGEVLSKPAISCYYRILYELNKVKGIDEIQGGASAGADNVPKTAFVTWRATLAMLSFVSAFEQTSKALTAFSEFTQLQTSICSEEWCSVEKQRLELQSEIAIRNLQRNSLFTLKDIHNYSNRYDTITKLCDRLKVGRQNINTVITEASEVPNFLSANTCDGDAHKIAVKSMTKLLEQINKLIELFENIKPDIEQNAELLKKASKTSSKISSDIRLELNVTAKFLLSVMDREFITTLDPQKNFDAVELIFAADAYGLLRKWKDKRLVLTLEKTIPLLTSDGCFPSNRPFDRTHKGYVLHVSGVEVLNAISHLIIHTEYEVSPEVIKKFLQFFIETWRDDAKGWRHERDHSSGGCSWWVSALSIDALNSLKMMIDNQINLIIFKHVNVRRHDKLSLELKDLFYPDYGLVASKVRERSLAIDFQLLLAHLFDINLDEYEKLYAVILHGPPGTGKTTPVEALAKTAKVPLVQITPSDIILYGEEKVETRARFVFEALSLLTNCVIIFDEFDSILRKRSDDETLKSIFQFLTPGMLTKVTNLHESAKVQKVVYVLATNIIEGIDTAMIREGRFDKKIGVYPPDALSRVGRLDFEISNIKQLNSDEKNRFDNIIRMSGGCTMSRLSKPGWFTKVNQSPKGTPFYYILTGDVKPVWPLPEKELPEEPTFESDYTECSLREWNEWKWVACMDELTIKKGAMAINEYITSWRESYATIRPGSTDWTKWKEKVEDLLRKMMEK